MRFFARLAAALAALCLLGSAALADTTSFSLTTSWQKIASAGSQVDVAAFGGTAVLTTANSTPTNTSGSPLSAGQDKVYSLAADLYALSYSGATVTVTTGVSSASNPTVTTVQTLTPAGSTGLDASANAPAIPNVGAGFGSTGPYANYVFIQTIPANQARLNVEIDNTSGGQIAVVRDDGTASPGAAPVNASVFPLAGGAAVGQQGGSWSSNTFKGRLSMYGPSSSASVTVMLD